MNGFNLVEFVGSQQQMFNERISDDKITFAKESQFAIQVLQANSFLHGVAAKNPASFQNAIINIAQIGISLNPANKHAYLVPREGKVCLDISYMGLIHLAISTGSIKLVECNLIHKNDKFKRVGVGKAPIYEIDEFGDRGEIVGAYCSAKTADGDFLTEVMTVNQINDVMARSQGFKSGKQSPWKTDWCEMARKTVVKRASKYWPKVDRLDNAIHHLNTDSGEGIESQPERDISPCTPEQLNQISAQLNRIGRTESQLLEKLIPSLTGRHLSSLDELTIDEAVKVISDLERR